MTDDRSLTQCVVDKAIAEYGDVGNSSQSTWEGLEEVYYGAAQAIIGTGQSINNLIADQNIRNALNANQNVVTAVNTLGKDLKTFTEELRDIHQEHTGKTGPIISEEDMVLSLNVFGKYQDFTTKFQAVTIPTMAIVTEAIGEAMEEVKKAQEAEKTISTLIPETKQVQEDDTNV